MKAATIDVRFWAFIKYEEEIELAAATLEQVIMITFLAKLGEKYV